MNETVRVLLVDDEEQFRFMTRMSLEPLGYEVIEAPGGEQALQILRQDTPDLVLLDLGMPGIDGHEVCSRIKSDFKMRFIPVIILTSSDDLTDKLRSFEGDADDYLTKYADIRELEARMRMVLRRNKQNLDRNPLTQLPGNNVIREKLKRKLSEPADFAVAYTDLDNFKAFNDKYGFALGDEVIVFTANILEQIVRNNGIGTEFVGHIGGDDFVLVAETDIMLTVVKQVVADFDSGIPAFYNEEDRSRGCIESADRQGMIRRFPLVSISVAVLNIQPGRFENIGEIVEIITGLKKYAKSKEGSCYVYDKREY